ncbi:MAG: hypothetical protein NZ899_10475 [Thermoguttaceae bacterium]|nr:hypothetical protein [Thermoguttaceae bacterium]MDW8078170.1 hypothetical protein [Thermoguttaceae bacterium]
MSTVICTRMPQAKSLPFALTPPLAALIACCWLPHAHPQDLGHGGTVPAKPFEYFRNPWTVVGLKDYAAATRVSPEGKLHLPDGRQVVIRLGPEAQPFPRHGFAALCDGWLPIVCFRAEYGGIAYEVAYWASPLPEVKNWEEAYAWPVAGDGYSTWIRVLGVNRGTASAEGAVHLVLFDGTNVHHFKKDAALGPGESCQWAFRLDFSEKIASDPADVNAGEQRGIVSGRPAQGPIVASPEEADRWLARTKSAWQKLLAQGAQLEVPCQKATLALKAAHVCQLITSDHGEVHGGEGFYDELYIRDGAYQILHLLEWGFFDAASRAIERFLVHQRPDGRFETQAGQLDANGQALWALWKYYRMTGDGNFLRRVYPQMSQAAEWIRQARRQESANSPYAGLLPAAVADGEYLWDGTHHIVGYDFWNLRGLICVAEAAEALGLADDVRRWRAEADDYRQAIERAWQATGLPYFPPSWEKEGTHWGNTETLWPTLLFDPQDPRVTALIRHLRKEFGGGYYEGTIRWIGHRAAIHPYMGAYTALASLHRGEKDDFLSDFFWYLVHSSATHGFPEGIYPESRTAWNNTIPHALGAANYAILLRHMLVHEEDEHLVLLKGVPGQWLAPGKQIRLVNAPTEFGQIDMELEGTAEGIRGKISARWRGSGPRSVHAAAVRGKWLVQTDGIDESRFVVTCGPPTTGHWDYEAVLAQYEKEAPPRVLPQIPHVEPLPPIPPPDPSRCRPVDLRSLANTDPFSAPFGVPRPGKYLFTGMPTGDVNVLGIPFTIIDPQRNEGRGLVVLHSEEYPAAAQFPRQVEIPVNELVRRVYFLGNVGGWTAKDAAAGQDGACAEYRLVYEDGSEDVVPLIPGRTIDDWAGPPQAEDASPVLRGKPWHLNLLAVKAQPKTLVKICFVDLGTPTAPVLAAVTVEK